MAAPWVLSEVEHYKDVGKMVNQCQNRNYTIPSSGTRSALLSLPPGPQINISAWVLA